MCLVIAADLVLLLLVPLQDAESSFGGAGDMALLGRVVFQNAASCLRVRHGAVSALQNEADFDAVDDIRIHPQSEAMLQVQNVGIWI